MASSCDLYATAANSELCTADRQQTTPLSSSAHEQVIAVIPTTLQQDPSPAPHGESQSPRVDPTGFAKRDLNAIVHHQESLVGYVRDTIAEAVNTPESIS